MRFKIFFFLAFFTTSAVTAQLYDNRNRYLQSPYNYNRFGQELDAPPKKPTNQYATRVKSSQNSYNNYQNRVNQYSRAYLTTDEFYKRFRDPEIHRRYASSKNSLGGSESGINLKDCHCNYGLDIKAFDSWYQAQQMGRRALLKQYEGLFEKKIEKLLNKNFPSFKEAQKAFYKDYAKIYQNHYRAEAIKFSESNLQKEIIIAFESASANETIWKTFYNGYNGEGKISKDGERIWFGDLRSNNELIRDLIRSTHRSRAKSTKLRTLNSKVRGLLKDFEISKEIKTQLQRSSSLFYDYLADEYIAHYESLKYDYEHLLGAFNNYLIQYAENIPSIAMYGRKYSGYMIHRIPYNENNIWNALRKKVEGTINTNQNYSSNVSFARAKAIFALDRLNLPTLYWANRSFAQKRRDTSARKKRPLPLPCEPQDVSAKKTHVNNVVRAIKNKEPLRKAVLTYLEHATPYQQELNTITEAVGCRLNGSPFNWSELVNFPKYTFQSSANPEVVLQIDLSENKVHKNISYRGIADVLKYIYNVEKYWHVEGATIRHFLESKTNVKIPGSLSNYDLGKLFDFGGGNSNTLTIQFSDYAKKYITNFQHYDGKYGTSLFTDLVKLKKLYDILKERPVDFSNNKKPCIGDPVPNPEIAPSGISGKKGGTFGCTRVDVTVCKGMSGRKNHDGLDITAEIDAPLYATHSGTIFDVRNLFSSGEYKKNSYGNFIIIKTTINGKLHYVKYNHLNRVDVKKGEPVVAGNVIGLNGNTGNANPPIKPPTPHLHMQVFDSNWNSVNPLDFIKTKFDSNFNPINPNCN